MKINKKAFTIAEIVTVLAVVSVIMALTAGLIVSVFNITDKQRYSAMCATEYEESCSFIDSFLNNYGTDKYSLLSVTTVSGISTIKITDNINEYSLTYNKAENKIDAELFDIASEELEHAEKQLTCVVDITFTNQSNLIKCEFEFKNHKPLSKLFTFGV